MSGILDESSFVHLDIPSEVERYTSTRLHPTSRSGKQFSGACPYDDCSVDTDGFTVWPELTERGCHYYCRGCRRAGDIVKLIMEIRGYSFQQALEVLGIANPYRTHPGSLTRSIHRSLQKRGPLPPTDDQVRELDLLKLIYPRMRRALQHPKARAYLAQRGIPSELACVLGLGYIPPFEVPLQVATDDQLFIRGWCDRIIFPLISPAGQGFTGRSLAYWQEGMDENEHKKLLDQYKIPRYLTTYPAGYFHAEVLETCEHVTFTEGPFDACALIAGGITDSLATCGISLDIAAIPIRICDATLAYDGDEKGENAAADLYKTLRRHGISARISVPPEDGKGKDWNERYRLHGLAGLNALLPIQKALPPQHVKMFSNALVEKLCV